ILICGHKLPVLASVYPCAQTAVPQKLFAVQRFSWYMGDHFLKYGSDQSLVGCCFLFRFIF
ncbi:hypothetical protein PanWU01x14_227250, partial [Parasponia andersonii]